MFLLAHITGRKSKFGKKEINQVDADCILEERDYASRIQINVRLATTTLHTHFTCYVHIYSKQAVNRHTHTYPRHRNSWRIEPKYITNFKLL